MRHARLRGSIALTAALVTLTTVSAPASATDVPDPASQDQAMRGAGIPDHFVGFSIEWSLIEQYMGPGARPAFANLLANLDTGVLRIGGSSQDQTPFDAAASNTNQVITPEDLAAIRSTLDGVNGRSGGGGTPRWGVVLGSALAPATTNRPWIGPDHTKAFISTGVQAAFAGAEEYVAGVELGNEPDLTYHSEVPHDLPGANVNCGTGAVGVNFRNAEVRAFFHPEEGNGYYNAINFDPSAAAGAPIAAPEYYAILRFARLAQGAHKLRPMDLSGVAPDGSHVSAWQVDQRDDRRLFLINKDDEPVTLTVPAPGARYSVNRMTPYDPTGSGRTLDAPAVRIDGREVAADGTWPGFQPTVASAHGGRLTVRLAPGETVVLTR
jgi:hypothetical protein